MICDFFQFQNKTVDCKVLTSTYKVVGRKSMI
jgi:hypothetical protein